MAYHLSDNSARIKIHRTPSPDNVFEVISHYAEENVVNESNSLAPLRKIVSSQSIGSSSNLSISSIPSLLDVEESGKQTIVRKCSSPVTRSTGVQNSTTLTAYSVPPNSRSDSPRHSTSESGQVSPSTRPIEAEKRFHLLTVENSGILQSTATQTTAETATAAISGFFRLEAASYSSGSTQTTATETTRKGSVQPAPTVPKMIFTQMSLDQQLTFKCRSPNKIDRNISPTSDDNGGKCWKNMRKRSRSYEHKTERIEEEVEQTLLRRRLHSADERPKRREQSDGEEIAEAWQRLSNASTAIRSAIAIATYIEIQRGINQYSTGLPECKPSRKRTEPPLSPKSKVPISSKKSSESREQGSATLKKPNFLKLIRPRSKSSCAEAKQHVASNDVIVSPRRERDSPCSKRKFATRTPETQCKALDLMQAPIRAEGRSRTKSWSVFTDRSPTTTKRTIDSELENASRKAQMLLGHLPPNPPPVSPSAHSKANRRSSKQALTQNSSAPLNLSSSNAAATAGRRDTSVQKRSHGERMPSANRTRSVGSNAFGTLSRFVDTIADRITHSARHARRSHQQDADVQTEQVPSQSNNKAVQCELIK